MVCLLQPYKEIMRAREELTGNTTNEKVEHDRVR